METYDVAVIGGSFAGLTAAMILGRSRKRVLVLDHGRTRNRFSPAGHGFPGLDGLAPAEMVARIRAQALAYPTVARIEAEVTGVQRDGTGFALTHAAGPARAGRLILAYGMRDTLPDLPGLAECWGHSALMCPYCHGYEAAGLPTGYLMTADWQAEHVRLLADWTDDMLLFANGHRIEAPARAMLAAAGIGIVEGRVAALEQTAGQIAAVVLEDGRRLPRQALYVSSWCEPAAPFAEALGCQMAETPAGRHVVAGERGETSQPGIWAAGDLVRPWFNALRSASEGMLAAASVHRSMVFGGAQ